MASDIMKKIGKEFDQLNAEEGNQEDLDLLDMMDGE